MGAQGYFAETVTVGTISDKIIEKPNGSGTQQITPTVAAAIARTARDSGTAPYYTKTSSSVLVLTVDGTPGFTTGSKIGVFWTGTDGSANFCLDCTITSVIGSVVTITAPLATLSALQLAAGMLYFNGAATTGAGDVAGKKITAGSTEVTFSLATLATADLPANKDIIDYTIDVAALLQLLITCDTLGAVELFVSGTLVLAHNYAYSGNFFSWVSPAAAPWTGVVDSIRFYNSTTAAQTMYVGALMS